MLSFWSAASADARRALVAASLGWLLDAFDVMLYALVVTSVMADLAIDRPTAGLLGSLTLAASAVGGIVFGIVADRWGRTRALSLSILIYSVFTAACGLAQDVLQLAVFRLFLGIGMGGEWASGAALVSETWPAEHRGKALGLMQSCWAIGYGLAALVNMLVQPLWGWRAVFFVGIIPALFTLWIRRRVHEPELWLRARRAGEAGRENDDAAASRSMSSGVMPHAAAASSPHASRATAASLLSRLTIAVTLMNAATMFAWWGFNQWIPAYLSLGAADGGIGLSTTAMSWFIIVMQVGMWFGYVTFGFVSDRVGRKPTYVVYLVAAAVLVFVYSLTTTPALLLLLGPFVAFFGTGYFSGFGAITAEIYPTSIRATAQGLTYNVGRIASAIAPFTVASISQTSGFGVAFMVTAAAFLVAAALWSFIPETRGRALA
jgi:MFS family permease